MRNLEAVKATHYTHARFYNEGDLYINQDPNFFFDHPDDAAERANFVNKQNSDVPAVQERPFFVVQVTKTTVVKKV